MPLLQGVVQVFERLVELSESGVNQCHLPAKTDAAVLTQVPLLEHLQALPGVIEPTSQAVREPQRTHRRFALGSLAVQCFEAVHGLREIPTVEVEPSLALKARPESRVDFEDLCELCLGIVVTAGRRVRVGKSVVVRQRKRIELHGGPQLADRLVQSVLGSERRTE